MIRIKSCSFGRSQLVTHIVNETRKEKWQFLSPTLKIVASTQCEPDNPFYWWPYIRIRIKFQINTQNCTKFDLFIPTQMDECYQYINKHFNLSWCLRLTHVSQILFWRWKGNRKAVKITFIIKKPSLSNKKSITFKTRFVFHSCHLIQP